MYEMDSLVEETPEEVLLYISSIVGQSQVFIQLSIQILIRLIDNTENFSDSVLCNLLIFTHKD